MGISSLKRDGLMLKIIELILYEIILFGSYYISLVLDLFNGYDARNYEAFMVTVPWLMFISIFVFHFVEIFKTVNKSKSENIAIIFIALSSLSVIYMALAFFLRGFALPRSIIFLAFIIQLFSFTAIKLMIIQLIRKIKGRKRIMIIGPMIDKEMLISKILGSYVYKESLNYYLDPYQEINYLNFIDKVEKIYLSDMIDNIIKDKIITHCISTDKSLYMIPKTFEIAIFNSNLFQVSDIPMFKIDSLYLSRERMIIKRVFDLLVAIPMLIILSPIMLLVAFLILVTDGRPILYTQERVTLNNKQMLLYKFRSMKKDAEKDTGAVWATENDPRVTELGRFLRKFWLDELPQLFNVIKGDMSLVGPRPERPIFIEQFSKEIPDFQYRLSVKAGVTGLAQVLGKYATSPENKIKFDLLYIKNSSLMFDIKILFETLKKIIMGTLKRGENTDLTYCEILQKLNLSEISRKGYTEFHN